MGEASPFILKPVDEKLLNSIIFKKYEKSCRALGVGIKRSGFNDILELLKIKCSYSPKTPSDKSIPLSDGTVINLKEPDKISQLDCYSDFSLPITSEEWLNPRDTPTFDRATEEHLDKEDQDFFKLFLGYVFSMESIKHKQCMLILHGPKDTGKSTILDWLASVIPNFVCKLSVFPILFLNNQEYH